MPPTSLKAQTDNDDDDDRLDDAQDAEHDARDRDAAVGGFSAPGLLPAEEAENHRDDAEHHAADNENSAMIATTSAAMPKPVLRRLTGGGAYPV